MMKTAVRALSLGVLMTIAATVPGQALDRRVTIVNNTSYTIVEFYASSVGQDTWEEDILGPDVLPSGGTVVVNIDDGTGYCKYDLKGIFEDGDEAIKKGVNVCEVASFTFND